MDSIVYTLWGCGISLLIIVLYFSYSERTIFFQVKNISVYYLFLSDSEFEIGGECYPNISGNISKEVIKSFSLWSCLYNKLH